MTPTAAPVTYGGDPSLYRFSLQQFQRMIELGIITAEDRFEYLETHLVLQPPTTPRHDATLDLLKAVLPGQLPAGWLLRIQQTVVLSDSQPEPDFAVVRGGPRTYLSRQPAAADVGLV